MKTALSLLLLPLFLSGYQLKQPKDSWDLVKQAHADPEGFRENHRKMMNQGFKMMQDILKKSRSRSHKKNVKPVHTFPYLLKQLAIVSVPKRNNIIMELYRDYPFHQITRSMIQWIKKGTLQQKIVAVYTASILKSPKYQPYFKKLFKQKNLDPVLKRELMIATGTNGFKKLNRYICGYISSKYDQQAALGAIQNIGEPICKKAIKQKLLKGTPEEQKRILKLFIRVKYRMKKVVQRVFRKSSGKLKKEAAMALIAMGDPAGGEYIKTLFKKSANNHYQLYQGYRTIHKSFPYSNKIAREILISGFQQIDHTDVRLYCGVSLLFRGVPTPLKQEIETTLKSFEKSDKMAIITILARYKTYLKYQQKKH